jgi:hypothetical protein
MLRGIEKSGATQLVLNFFNQKEIKWPMIWANLSQNVQHPRSGLTRDFNHYGKPGLCRVPKTHVKGKKHTGKPLSCIFFSKNTSFDESAFSAFITSLHVDVLNQSLLSFSFCMLLNVLWYVSNMLVLFLCSQSLLFLHGKYCDLATPKKICQVKNASPRVCYFKLGKLFFFS